MALADLADLQAIGAIGADVTAADVLGVRATRLLAMASGHVCTFARTTETIISDPDPLIGWSPESKTSLSAIVAEIAGRRLTAPAAPSSNQLGDVGPAPYLSIRLTAGDRALLLEIPEVAASRSTSTPTTLTLERDNPFFSAGYYNVFTKT